MRFVRGLVLVLLSLLLVITSVTSAVGLTLGRTVLDDRLYLAALEEGHVYEDITKALPRLVPFLQSAGGEAAARSLVDLAKPFVESYLTEILGGIRVWLLGPSGTIRVILNFRPLKDALLGELRAKFGNKLDPRQLDRAIPDRLDLGSLLTSRLPVQELKMRWSTISRAVLLAVCTTVLLAFLIALITGFKSRCLKWLGASIGIAGTILVLATVFLPVDRLLSSVAQGFAQAEVDLAAILGSGLNFILTRVRAAGGLMVGLGLGAYLIARVLVRRKPRSAAA